jgi:hypothetical protein
MTDRELLELAAKAAAANGMPIIDSEAGPQILERKTADGTECYRIWNPLTVDGDALRLAVKLGIGVQSFSSFGHSHAGSEQITRSIVIKEQHGSEPYDATRRAIVRAAAEIGKEMK